MANSSALSPISIKIGGDGLRSFKSIDNVTWSDIGGFSVLTGPNGSGKTQLLEIIAYRLGNGAHPEVGDISGVQLQIEGDTYGEDEVAYVPSHWQFTGTIHLSIADMQNVKQNLYNNLQHTHTHDVRLNSKRRQILRSLNIGNVGQITQEEFSRKLSDDFAFMLDDTDVIAGLGHVFLGYRLRLAGELERGSTKEKAIETLGKPPWDLVNDILVSAEFPYQVSSPLGSSLLEHFQLKLIDDARGITIRPADLSSGEKMLLGVALWLYNTKHHNRFPRLLLLDEPDAHLHPSMTRHFISILKNVLVEKYRVRVILTTHSPSTVALAPLESIFEMSRVRPRIARAVSKQAAIATLTSGLVTVSQSTRYVLTEDEADVDFYSAMRDILTDYGPSRDRAALAPEPTVVFLPSSRGKGALRVGGGSSAVVQWVEKFDGDPLRQIFSGIIDRDHNNIGNDRVRVIGRYSIENYLLDPLVVFAMLNARGKASFLGIQNVSPGDEHLIRSLEMVDLKLIVNGICRAVAMHIENISEQDLENLPVSFTNGVTLEYPSWVVNRRGHDLLVSAQAAFGGANIVNAPNLLGALKRARMVPVELAAVLKDIQEHQVI